MNCTPDYWFGFWLGVIIALALGTVLYVGLHHLCKESPHAPHPRPRR